MASPTKQRSGPPLWVNLVPLGALLLLVCIIAGSWWFAERSWERSTERQVHLATNQAALRLQDFVASRLLAAGSLGDGLPTESDSEGAFRIRSLALQENFGGFQALNWVNVDGEIALVVPEERNKGAVGKNVLESVLARPTFLIAREQRLPNLTAPLDLFQGGRGMAAYIPVRSANGDVVGMLNAVFRLSALVEQSLAAGILDSYRLSIVDNEELVYSTKSPPKASDRPVAKAEVKLLNRRWTLRASPNDALWASLRAGQQRWLYWLGLGLAGICAWFMRGAALRSWQRREDELERQELQLELERASKMQALGRLAGGVAHDFNNILTAIVGNAELIRRLAPEKNTQSLLNEIVASADRAAGLTQDLMSFSAPSLEESASIDVNAQVLELRRLLQRLVPDSVALKFEPTPRVGWARCSQTQLGQILVNLAVNACDAMPEGGQLTISTLRHSETPEDLRMEVQSSANGWCVLRVCDSGAGMNKATQERLFEPYYSTKQRGSGLGLSTVYSIVQSLGGSIEISSEESKGTTFEVWLPGVPDNHEEQDQATATTLDTPIRRWRILLAEDNSDVRETTAAVMREFGMEVVVAEDGQEALERLWGSADLEAEPSGVADFDVVVTDADMPRLSGPELLKRMRARGVSLPVIIVSGYSEELLAPTFTSDENTRVLSKPYRVQDLLEILGTLPGPESSQNDDSTAS